MTRFSLATLAIVTALIVPSAHTQSIPNILQETAQYYQNLDAYEFDGDIKVQLPGTGRVVDSHLALLFPKRGSLPENAVYDETASFKSVSPARVEFKSDPSLRPIGYPLLGRFQEMTHRMLSAEKIGIETLQLNNKQVPCEIWKVHYSSDEEHPRPQVVTYWITTATHLVASHLVLKETILYSTAGRNDALATVTLDTAKFNVPTPQRILDRARDAASRNEIGERKDWAGKPAPDFTLISVTGEPVKLSALRGKPVLLDFWAISCAPCRLEMPIVENLGETYEKRGVQILGVGFDESDKARAWLAKNNHNLNSLDDSNSTVSDLYKVKGIPVMVLIGRDGNVSHYWDGPASKTQLQAAFESALQ